ncbi:MAG: hypothetical protein V7K67_02180 [Nostoc sp.]|uniref:hypothetical protein n=1 Tax=Nostoc sp. TaxID=1180 RepID=UPI002FFAA73C
MTNLIAYNNDGLEIYIDDKTGESFASISSYARMAGLTQQAISKRVRSHNSEDTKKAEIKTGVGCRYTTLLTENIIAEWIIKDNPTIAVQFLKLGIRKFMYSLAGYSQPQPQAQVTAPQQVAKALPSEYDLKFKNIRDRKNAATKDIHELQVQIDELKGIWESLDAEEDTLVIDKHRAIADDVIRRREKVAGRQTRTKEETDAMFAKAWGFEDK